MPNDAVLSVVPANLPEGACFATEQERLIAFARYLRVVLPGNYSTVNTGSSTPNANDRDKKWIRDNPDGSPDGTYTFFDGTWKRKHPLDPGFIGLFTGSSSEIPTLDGGEAGVITTISGAFWEVATEFNARFPLGVGTLPSSTAVAALGTGGEEKHTLLTTELPSVLGDFASGVDRAIGRKATAGATTFGSIPSQYHPLEFNEFIQGGDDTPHNNMPPYVGAYFIRRTSRLYYSI